MNDSAESSSSSDGDIYTNAVARLKALKTKKKLKSIRIKEAPFVSDDSPKEIIHERRSRRGKKQNLEPVISVEEEIAESIELDDEELSEKSDDLINTNKSGKETIAANKKSNAPTHCIANIVLDSDDNEDVSMEMDTSKNDLSGNENYIIEVKVLWQSHKLVRLDMGLHEPFQKAFEYFAELENIPLERILLLRKDQSIKFSDTPASLQISVIDIIEGGVMDTEYVADQRKKAEDANVNTCKIKVQLSQKTSINVILQKNQSFKFTILQCATQLKVPESKIKLYFDGDLISPSDTPESLDLEDEACIDLKVTP